jgi:integrase
MPKTSGYTRTVLTHFMEFVCQYAPSAQLAKGFLARYANYNRYTLARYSQMIKAFMQWYCEPLTDVHIKIPKNLPSYTEDSDIEKLLAAVGDKQSHKKLVERDRLLIDTALKTGLRRFELANLKPKEIHENALIVRQIRSFSLNCCSKL